MTTPEANRPLTGDDVKLRDRIEAMSEWEPNTGCLLWFGATRAGYPKMKVGRRTVGVHRVSLLESLSLSSSPLHVLHRCDTPMCVNPGHLFFGTHAQNMADKSRKGRSVRSYDKTTHEVRRKIFSLFSDGVSKRRIAVEMGVSPKTVQVVISKEGVSQ